MICMRDLDTKLCVLFCCSTASRVSLNTLQRAGYSLFPCITNIFLILHNSISCSTKMYSVRCHSLPLFSAEKKKDLSVDMVLFFCVVGFSI